MKFGRMILVFILLANIIFLSGCWNYKDIEEMLIVSGFSIDKNMENNAYLVSFEVLDFVMSGKEAKQTSKLIESEGVTLFDALRNAINFTGKRLYIAHIKLIIVSQDIAREGITPILDFLYRDAELNEKAHIIISKEKTAKEVLEQQTLLGELQTQIIHSSIQSQSSLAKTPEGEINPFVNLIEAEGVSPTLPTVIIKKNDGKTFPELDGTAVFKSDRLVGFLNHDETKSFLFIANKVKKGLLIISGIPDNLSTSVSLEIFGSNTSAWPEYTNGKPVINIRIKPEAAIGEIESSIDYVKDLVKLKKYADESLRSSVESLIKKVQTEYGSDIFGFGTLVRANMPKYWKSMDSEWDEVFRMLEVNISVDITIRNSALTSKSIRKGD